MTLILAALALTALPQSAAPPSGPAQVAPAETTDPSALAGSAAVHAAREWLALVDAGNWSASYQATGQSFRQLNTPEKWASVSEEARPPMGAVRSRSPISEESVPAPPYGYQMVKFASSFANRPTVTETVTLMREDGAWRVVGYWID